MRASPSQSLFKMSDFEQKSEFPTLPLEEIWCPLANLSNTLLGTIGEQFASENKLRDLG